MINRTTLLSFLEETLGQETLVKARQQDEMANGPQFIGDEDVQTVTLGVSLNEEFLQSAISLGSNFCIFHHGFDPRTYKSAYSLSQQKRLRLIANHTLTIVGYHAALDMHPTLGNNATIIKKLGATPTVSLFEDWGYVGRFEKPQKVTNLAHRCTELFAHDVFAVYAGPEKVTTIGVVSGAAKPHSQHIAEMEQKGVELFITGETSESIPHTMQESGINYFACGHYATEVFGIQQLGEKIKEKFGKKITVEFIDIPNPI